MKKVIYGLVLSAMLATPVMADADKKVGVNILFNSEGFQGGGIFVAREKVELHVAHTENNGMILGAGYRVADSEGRGTDGDRHESASLTLGGAYVGGPHAGLRPFGQVNLEFDLNTEHERNEINMNVGFISYGMGLGKTIPSDQYVYVGIASERNVENEDSGFQFTEEENNSDSGDGNDDNGDGGNDNDSGDNGNNDDGNGDSGGDNNGGSENEGENGCVNPGGVLMPDAPGDNPAFC